MDMMSPSPIVWQTRDGLGVSRAVFSRLTGCSEGAIVAWESGKSVSPKVLKRIHDIQRLQEALAELIEADEISTWLERQNPAFGGITPLEVMERGEFDRIWTMIRHLDSGEPS